MGTDATVVAKCFQPTPNYGVNPFGRSGTRQECQEPPSRTTQSRRGFLTRTTRILIVNVQNRVPKPCTVMYPSSFLTGTLLAAAGPYDDSPHSTIWRHSDERADQVHPSRLPADIVRGFGRFNPAEFDFQRSLCPGERRNPVRSGRLRWPRHRCRRPDHEHQGQRQTWWPSPTPSRNQAEGVVEQSAQDDTPRRSTSRRSTSSPGWMPTRRPSTPTATWSCIATPPGFRPQQFEYAVAKDKHVFMEKPVATDAPAFAACWPPSKSRRRRT